MEFALRYLLGALQKRFPNNAVRPSGDRPPENNTALAGIRDTAFNRQ